MENVGPGSAGSAGGGGGGGGGDDDADEERMIFDFGFGFRGSVFEEFHVAPVQLAALDTSVGICDVEVFLGFVSRPGAIQEMMESVDDFGQKFQEYCREKFQKYCKDFQAICRCNLRSSEQYIVHPTGMAKDFAAQFLQFISTGGKDNKNDTTKKNDSVDEGADAGGEVGGGGPVVTEAVLLDDLIRVEGLMTEDKQCAAVKRDFAALFFCHWVLHRDALLGNYLARWHKGTVYPSPPRLGNCFGRWGRDVQCESDQTITRQIYDYCEKELRLAAGETYRSCDATLEILSSGLLGFLVDFDLVGSDGRKYPLRMLMLDGKFLGVVFPSHAWSASISEREKGALIARADYRADPSQRANYLNPNDDMRIQVVAEELVERHYKPHGDIPTMLERWSNPVLRVKGCEWYKPRMYPNIAVKA
ncbi:hypothetical protein CBR_g39063 [Chara braunii]|uniref:Uncharacterized protein n=1 Tax=Chara braunii TaxID=69332 RepID=A0A388LQS3_CHABU|nr:hypothetical protein CBR_g39063 [Chara braunii]|eukprot:GBG84688.1 hypothetical protein CBR_g39063 [Chara braunii]